ncbi:MAG: prepilin-type N-terminal cleavage/methylation domain-containing protein [Pirellulales bacterium]|nr:prepilin-type N-terminal cleavage/methylation domain-containing protein [Pirellulales bacterium]
MSKLELRLGYTLVELLTVVTLLGVIATIVITHVTSENSGAKAGACHTYKGDIEIQAEIWMHNRGTWPAGNLADIGADTAYFPEGLPTCPVDSTAYTIDTATGLVIGHNH